MGTSGRLKDRKLKSSTRISEPRVAEISPKDLPPAFSLRYIQHNLDDCEKEEKAAFADAMYKRREMTWQEIETKPRHGLGCEVIKKGLKVRTPDCVGDRKILSLRFCGMKPMIGFREKEIFYVLWFDREFKIYKH